MKNLYSKKIYFLIPLIILIIGCLFWKEIACFSLDVYLKKFCEDNFKGSFESTRIYNENENWIIDHPQITGHQPLTEGGIHFHAEKIILKFIPHFSSRQIDLSVTVIKPNLNVKQTAADVQSIVSEMFSSPSLFRINTKISITEGSLHFHNFKQDPPTLQTLYFQLEGESQDRHKGQVVISLDDPLLLNNCVMFSLAQVENQLITLDFNLDNVKCAALLNAASNFIPTLQYLNISEGLVSGQMTLTIPEEGKPFAKGDLALSNIHFSSPRLEVKGSIQQAYLHLIEGIEPDSKLSSDDLKEKITTKGYLELTKEAIVEFEKEGKPYCKITDLMGGIYFEKQDLAQVKLEGKCSHHETLSHLYMDGFAKVGKGQPHVNLDIQTRLSSPENPYAKAKLTIKSLETSLNYAEINLEHISSSDFDLLKMLFVPYFPDLHDVQMNKGFIDASVSAYLDGIQMTDVKIDKITANGVHFNLTPWGLVLKVGKLAGNFSVNLKSETILETLNADLDIADSHLCIFGENSTACQLSDIQTHLAIRKGVIEKSVVKGMFAGLKGTINLDGASSKTEIAKFNFKGEADEILDLVSEPIKNKLKNQFSNDRLSIMGGLQKIENGIKIEGALNVKGDKERFGQTIEFGFDLEKAPRVISNEAGSLVIPQNLLQEFKSKDSSLDPTQPDSENTLNWLKNELIANGISIKDGWCQAQNLPLEKYMEPFFFANNQVQLSGFGDFQATFNNHFAVVNFDLRQTLIENKSLSIDIKTLTDNLEKDSALPLPAAYYIDFDKGISYGLIPIANGTYFEKKSGLLFTDIHTLLLIKDKQVHLTQLSTSTTGMFFGGKIEVNLSSPINGVFQVHMMVEKIKGRFSQLQQLFSHFDSLTFLQKFPLEADVQFHEKGASLFMDFAPSGFSIKSHMSGSLSNGHFTMQNADMSLKDLKTNFEFDHEGKTLNFSDLQGNLVIGKGNRAQTYALAGDHISFTDFRKKQALFDIWIGDSSRDIFRIAGKTQATSLQDNSTLLEVILNPELSHFGDIRPKNFELSLKGDNQINKFNIEMGLKMETVLFNLQLAQRAGLIHFPSPLLTEFDEHIKTVLGDANLRFHYDDRTSAWTGHLDGTGVKIGPHQYNKFSLHGKKNGEVWAIDQLVLDNLSIAADLIRKPGGLKANFLGIRYGESLLVGMEGDFNEQNVSFDGHVNLLELNLDKLKEWPKLHDFVLENAPKGFLKGTGTIHAQTKNDTPTGWHVDLSLNTSLKSFHIREMSFEDSSNISCHYVSDRGLTFLQYKTALKDVTHKSQLGTFSLEKIDYDFNKNELGIESLAFNIPAIKLQSTVNQLQNSFPTAINSHTAEIVKNLKSETPLEGHFDLTHSPASTQIQIGLKDDTYHFLGKDHETHHLVLKHNLSSLKILTQYRINSHLFWLSVQTTASDFNSGLMTLSDHYPDIHHKGQPALHIHWHVNNQDGFLIDKAHGLFSGLKFNLTQDKELLSNNEAFYLQGSITMDPNKASKLISDTLSTKLASFELGDGFELRGKWCIEKNFDSNAGLPIHFQGNMLGQNVVIKGYEFQTLAAQVNIHPQNIYIQHLKIEDPSVKVSVEQAHFFQNEKGEWICNIPSIHFNELRPSLLHEPSVPPSKQPSSLVVRFVEIENLYGSLSDTKTLTGKGKLQFLNTPKKNLAHTIFAIPGEILTMLGLNLSVLNPVSGTVFYEIRENKFYLNKFKDVYSEGKLSKFYLNDSKEPSFVDFDGNLSLQIRMKQYNLFFKLAELFTVNVGGNLKKPSYSLHKHSSHKETANK